jgi:hypothetical protein
MSHQAIANELNVLLASERRSLLRHIDEAKPYVDAKTHGAWKKIQVIIKEDRHHDARLSALIDQLNLREDPGVFQQDVGHFHYMTIDRLLAEIIEDKQTQLAAYKRAIRLADREPGISGDLQTLLDENLDEMQQLQMIKSELEAFDTAKPAVPVEATADLQNIANVMKAQEALEAAKSDSGDAAEAES